jgi:hypothetical protein
VVLEEQRFGQIADRGRIGPGVAADGEQQLVLLGLDPGVAGDPLADLQEAPDVVADIGQGAVVDIIENFSVGHGIYRTTIIS